MCLNGKVEGDSVCGGLYLAITSFWLSLFGSLFILITYVIHKRTRTDLLRMVIYLAASDFINALLFIIGFLVPEYTAQTYCKIIGSVCSYFFITTFLWTSFIAIRLYKIAYGTYNKKNASNEEFWYNILA